MCSPVHVHRVGCSYIAYIIDYIILIHTHRIAVLVHAVAIVSESAGCAYYTRPRHRVGC